MRTVTYCRFSSDKQREASIEDQQRNCQKFAEREGWDIIGRYTDKAISGTKADRPEYQTMLADAVAGAFDLLLVDDLSRLSRDDVELKTTIRRFLFWGIRIVGVSDGFDSASKGYKIHAGVRGLINEIYLDDLREKTHRGMVGQVLKGNNAGGRTYGFRNVPIEDKSRKDEYGRPVIVAVRRKINPEQAKVVRQIFELYADGNSDRWIAYELNRRGVLSPRGSTWVGSAVRPMLRNKLYIGQYIWNRSTLVRNPDTGSRKRIPRPEDEWIVQKMPHLRIVPQDLWDRVVARRQEIHEKLAAIQRLNPKARTGAGPKYLFSSLLKCGVCGANYAMSNATHYACSTYINQGTAVCANNIRVSRRVVESRLLEAIKADLFTEEGIALFKKEVRRLLAERKVGENADKKDTRRDLQKVEKELANIMEAIKQGIITPTTKDALQEAEAEKLRLERILKMDLDGLENIETMLPRVVDRYRDLVENFETVPMWHVSKARTCIKALVGGDIRLVPTPQGGLNAELRGDYAGLVALAKENPGHRGKRARLFGVFTLPLSTCH